jgi:DNA ligase 1
MNHFAELYAALDSTTKSNAKVAALEAYFRSAPPADAAWATFFLRGGKLRAPFSSRLLRTWAAEAAGIPDWLFAECYDSVGDLAETAALLLPAASLHAAEPRSLHYWVESDLLPLRALPPDQQRDRVLATWQRLAPAQRFVWNKLITGGLRVGVSDGLVLRALSAVTGLPVEALAHRLAGQWQPSPSAWAALISPATADVLRSQPYPFYLAHPLTADPASLGLPTAWLIEHKWDGIRAQLIRRADETHLWSRGGEQLTARFPEIVAQAAQLPPGTVIDGELLAWRDEQPLPFAQLQPRITRKKLTASILQSSPARLLAFDLLEFAGTDLRSTPLAHRRQLLESLPLHLSPRLPATTWQEVAAHRAAARQLLAEGVMLKRLDSPYGVGREKGAWWKWKLEPYSVDAVLLYAQRGHGRRASLYTDYTFGLWDGDRLVPFAKAYSGLNDAEIRAVDKFIRQHTLAKFGPVCTVAPELVFEIAFEGLQLSKRHKSGIAVRFPRIARWRTDKLPADADSLASAKALLG